jgi:hypothetical protein
MWKLKDVAHGNHSETNGNLIRKKLMALSGKIPGMTVIEVGFDMSQGESSADVVLYSEFTNRQALAEYQVNPEHEALKPFIGEATTDRRIVDYEV